MARDWPEADRLRGEIEAAGWRVVDRGEDFALEPAHPPDAVEGDRVRYGSSEGVPSRLDEADAAPATLVILGLDSDLQALRDALVATGGAIAAATQVVVVADNPAAGAVAELDALALRSRPKGAPIEVLATSARLGPGACLNIALRRCIGQLVVVGEPGSRVTGDVIGPLVQATSAADIAVAGAVGLSGPDVRHLAPLASGDVVALDGRCIAVHRALIARRGQVDERFLTWGSLATWWTLRLRDAGEGSPPLRAVALDGLPMVQQGPPETRTDDPDRRLRRDRYRLLDRFGNRPDLFAPVPPGA